MKTKKKVRKPSRYDIRIGTALGYNCRIVADGHATEWLESNGRRAVRAVRRRTKGLGAEATGEVVMSWRTPGGKLRTKTLHQCHTDTRGRLSPRGEEV